MKPPERGEAPQVSEIVGQTTISSRSGSPHEEEDSKPALKSKAAIEQAIIENETRLIANRFAETLAKELAKQKAEQERTIDV